MFKTKHKTPDKTCSSVVEVKPSMTAVTHSITLSALIRSDCGILRPNAFAVLRLINNSNFVGCSRMRRYWRNPEMRANTRRQKPDMPDFVFPLSEGRERPASAPAPSATSNLRRVVICNLVTGPCLVASQPPGSTQVV